MGAIKSPGRSVSKKMCGVRRSFFLVAPTRKIIFRTFSVVALGSKVSTARATISFFTGQDDIPVPARREFMTDVVILGAGGLAREVSWRFRRCQSRREKVERAGIRR